MTDRESALRSLAVGDIFHGRAPNGASLFCLVTDVIETTICARRIHTQEQLQFDRRSGISLGEVKSRIDCVAPLPPEVHQGLLKLDKKYGEAIAQQAAGIELDFAMYKLTDAERRVHVLSDDHVSSNPI